MYNVLYDNTYSRCWRSVWPESEALALLRLHPPQHSIPNFGHCQRSVRASYPGPLKLSSARNLCSSRAYNHTVVISADLQCLVPPHDQSCLAVVLVLE